MALTGSSIASTYLKLLRANSDTMGADATASYIQDSADTDSALSISTTRVGIGTAAPTNNLHIEADAGDEGITIHAAGDTSNAVILDANRAGAGSGLGAFAGKWNGTTVGLMSIVSGDDTSNKDNGEILFFTAAAGSATERMRIDSSGNVGIGTTSPTDFGSTYTVLDVYNVGVGGYLLVRGSDITTEVGANDANACGIVGTRTNHPLQFDTNDTARMTIDTAGDVTFTGDLIMADGKGIDFSADASPAAGMTAEILDDYEEGTWTPAFTLGSGTADSLTIQYAQYTKVGRQVYFTARIVVGAISSPSGSCVISGLPFTAQTFGPLAFTCTGLADTDDYIPQGVVEVGETFAYLRLFRDGDEANTMAAKLQVSSAFIINGMYNV